jgi:hypothetical protein
MLANYGEVGPHFNRLGHGSRYFGECLLLLAWVEGTQARGWQLAATHYEADAGLMKVEWDKDGNLVRVVELSATITGSSSMTARPTVRVKLPALTTRFGVKVGETR